ncbi:MAG: dTMP kinase [Candidatus Riflebacteria bacterium]|nr:dTMP kinase [Candidatus Riflebacteria bacterium]
MSKSSLLSATRLTVSRKFPTSGRFVAFEGPEGSGKTTQIRRLAAKLSALGHDVVITREPGGTSFGDEVRRLLLDHSSGHLEAATELSLMLAQRSEHISKVIIPGLTRGAIVLTDRYIDSSLAYQGYGRALGADLVRRIHLELLGPCLPDLTVLFDLDPVVGLERARHGGSRSHDRLEAETLAFHQRVRDGYLAIAAAEPDRFIVQSAMGGIDDIFASLEQHILPRLTGSDSFR